VSTARVIAAHSASYADPIRIAKGELLVLTGREDIWDGHRWLWASAPDGREGWVPDTLVSAAMTACETYSAKELTCHLGERLTIGAQTHGWTWCSNILGSQGWVPNRSLAF